MINADVKMLIDEFNYRAERGMPPATVIFLKPVFEEGYLDTGMKARLTAVRPDPGFAKTTIDETVAILTFEFSEFQDFNVKRETANYYDSNGIPCLTATESGNYPNKHREDLYVMLGDETYYFTILDDDDERTVHFESNEERDMAVRGLMDLDALFEMRVNEAETAGDKKAAERAHTERATVAKALKAFGVDI